MKNLRYLPAALAIALSSVVTSGFEGAYYGTNYTVPFAHAYRALDALGVDRKEAIRRDVYHMSRLGLNAFRLHLWDVELSNADGDLLDNEHLDLLDYLVSELENRSIRIILTAQTNFGNGYPERNTNPNGAYSYNFEKCHVHDDPAAQAAQENYLRQLVEHRNRYTGRTLASDPDILAIEINNEPCHSGTHDEITAYVDRMANAIRQSGWKKDILYNVSHNLWRTSAFYNADIDGTTYQWYPTGLVHGSRRKGNFLPVLDNYDIPFDSVPGYADKSRVIYEYDPADVLDTYLYPAAARTFRKAGFQWITQFAYDPIDMARFNTEYQTHFLNLAYTPGKAIGMAIAAEVARKTPLGADYGKYPVDTVFGDFTVSARRDLAMLNDGEKYYHTNSTSDQPKDIDRLRSIAGVGSSPLVSTDGTGAYFLDRINKDVWRLEVMPDVIMTSDPFAKPSLHHTVAEIIPSPIAISFSIPNLRQGYIRNLSTGSIEEFHSGTNVKPGVYLLGPSSEKLMNTDASSPYGDGHRKIGEYVMPPVSGNFPTQVIHTPKTYTTEGEPLKVSATVISPVPVDSVVLYPSDVNFWNENNRLYPMEKTGKYTYSVTVDPKGSKIGLGSYGYYIVAYSGGEATTFPAGSKGTPLDWDFGAGSENSATMPYSSAVRPAGAQVLLLSASRGIDGAEFSSIPEAWNGIGITAVDKAPFGDKVIRMYRSADAPDTETITMSKYVRDIVSDCDDLDEHGTIKIRAPYREGSANLRIGLVTRDGFTYWAPVTFDGNGVASIPTSSLSLGETLLNPAPYPSFLGRRFLPDAATAMPFRLEDTESIVLAADGDNGAFSLDIAGIWIE